MSLALPSREKILDYLLSFDLFEQIGRPDEGRTYATAHLDRLIRTVKILPRLDGEVRVLELGASPYFMSILIQKYLGYDVTPANFFGDYGQTPDAEASVTISSKSFGERYDFHYKMFNVERSAFPYDDCTFDMVLCCEILEHLIMDPSHMLREAHRVLRQGGHLIISTPNAAKLEKVIKMARGKNIFEHYSGYGIYGRHNREYTADELINLLKLHNFEPAVVTDNIYPHSRIYQWLTSRGFMQNYRDNLYAVGRAIGPEVQHYPDWLYMHQWGRRAVSSHAIVMWDGEVFQLGDGWHGFENWPPGIRWTGREAVAFLKPTGKETTFGFIAYPGPGGTSGQVFINGTRIGTFALKPGAGGEVVLPLTDSIRSDVESGGVAQLEVRLCLENSFIPAQAFSGSKDTRELGIAVERLWLA